MCKRTNLTLGSLFDGSGGFPLGGILAGITPVWASEIEPFPIRVTTKRFPGMKHYGDVAAMDGSEIEPVDIITFGSPCTDLSIAGKRAGLEGQRSGLFFEAIRIIKEMRCATNGKYPRWVCWENVPGAFSSHEGQDFKAVLEAVIGIIEPGTEVPSPEKGRWPNADCYMGDGWSLAYRTLDAQHWGVPQRRRRIYLVADLADQCAGKVLFESEGLSGYSPAGFRAWQGAAGHPSDRSGDASQLCLNDQGGERMDVTEGFASTLRAEAHHPPCVMAQAVFENHSQDHRMSGPVETVPTITARAGTGGNNLPLVVGPDTPKTLKIRSGCEGGGKGALVQDDLSATLSCNNDQAVFVPFCKGTRPHSVEEAPVWKPANKANTLNTFDVGERRCNELVVDLEAISYSLTMSGRPIASEELAPTLMTRDFKDPTAVNSGFLVRRLTPIECARLQGFPDWWCAGLDTPDPTEADIAFWADVWETHRRLVSHSSRPKSRKQLLKWLAHPHTDAAEYKMWGNGVALPCVWFVLSGIAYYAQNSAP